MLGLACRAASSSNRKSRADAGRCERSTARELLKNCWSRGVNADELLAYMNARTNIVADLVARNRAEQWGGYRERLLRPVLTMHSIFDGQSFVSQEGCFAALVQAAGCSDQLVRAYVNAVGHASFSADQYLAVLGAMNSGLDSGVRPGPSLLPASKGFDLAYVPPPWIF